MKRKNDVIKVLLVCLWRPHSSGALRKTLWIFVPFNNKGWLDLKTLDQSLWLPVYSTCSHLPGALDWALGTVLHLMAPTVPWITPAVASPFPRLPRGARDPRNTLLAHGTWGASLTVALGPGDTCKKGHRMIDARCSIEKVKGIVWVICSCQTSHLKLYLYL